MGVIELHRIPMPCDVAVETGTCLGESTARLAAAFGEVHTIELADEIYLRAKERFAHLPHVHCHLGDSSQVLIALTPLLSGTVLFYLDAHWSGDASTVWGRFQGYGVDTARSKVPLLEELEVIVTLCRGPCVVYIDDMDKFDEHGNGRRDFAFEGEDWSHLTVASLYNAVAPRLVDVHNFGEQLVFCLDALHEK